MPDTPLRLLAILTASVLAHAVSVLPAGAQSDKDFTFPGTQQAQTQPENVSVRVELSDSEIAPGGRVVAAVVLDHAPGWHVHTNAPVIPASWKGFFAIPTTVDVEADGLTVGAIQWPEPHTIPVDLIGSGVPEPYAVFEGQAVIYVPLSVSPEAMGDIEVRFEVGYQACDDTRCDMPQNETFTVPLVVSADAEQNPSLESDLFSGFDISRIADQAEDPAPTLGGARPKFLGIIPLPAGGGLLAIAVLAAVGVAGGLVLNLTPCVLPVIPIKVLTISQHAGHPGRSAYLGAWMAAGVVAFWVAIGLPVALFASVTDPSRLFGIWWVTLGIGLLIGVMGVGIMGAFNITLPQRVYFINPKADSAWGSFVFGVMTAVLGLPCFGFVAGALLAGAATLPGGVIMVIFTSLGFGMALPYLVLSLNPKLIERIPRTGPASELVKQVMGLLLLAAAAYFVGAGVSAFVKADPVRAAELPLAAKAWHWWAIGALGGAAGLWLAYRTVTITKSGVRRAVFGLTGLAVALLGVAIAVNRTGKILNDFWVPYSPEALRQALDERKVVVLDFTADWCLNCQALKAVVLDPEPVAGELRSEDVVPMIADLTSDSAPGWDKLRDLGQTGIPLLYIDGPGLSEPWLANAYTAQQVLGQIRAARGEPAVAAR